MLLRQAPLGILVSLRVCTVTFCSMETDSPGHTSQSQSLHGYLLLYGGRLPWAYQLVLEFARLPSALWRQTPLGIQVSLRVYTVTSCSTETDSPGHTSQSQSLHGYLLLYGDRLPWAYQLILEFTQLPPALGRQAPQGILVSLIVCTVTSCSTESDSPGHSSQSQSFHGYLLLYGDRLPWAYQLVLEFARLPPALRSQTPLGILVSLRVCTVTSCSTESDSPGHTSQSQSLHGYLLLYGDRLPWAYQLVLEFARLPPALRSQTPLGILVSLRVCTVTSCSKETDSPGHTSQSQSSHGHLLLYGDRLSWAFQLVLEFARLSPALRRQSPQGILVSLRVHTGTSCSTETDSPGHSSQSQSLHGYLLLYGDRLPWAYQLVLQFARAPPALRRQTPLGILVSLRVCTVTSCSKETDSPGHTSQSQSLHGHLLLYGDRLPWAFQLVLEFARLPPALRRQTPLGILVNLRVHTGTSCSTETDSPGHTSQSQSLHGHLLLYGDRLPWAYQLVLEFAQLPPALRRQTPLGILVSLRVHTGTSCSTETDSPGHSSQSQSLHGYLLL